MGVAAHQIQPGSRTVVEAVHDLDVAVASRVRLLDDLFEAHPVHPLGHKHPGPAPGKATDTGRCPGSRSLRNNYDRLAAASASYAPANVFASARASPLADNLHGLGPSTSEACPHPRVPEAARDSAIVRGGCQIKEAWMSSQPATARRVRGTVCAERPRGHQQQRRVHALQSRALDADVPTLGGGRPDL